MTARKTVITVASAASLAMALPMVKHYEGLWLTVKPDTLAHGLPTGGYGETEGVRLGETHDEKYWSDRLAKRLPEYDAKIGACIHRDLPAGVRAVAISIAYNTGPAAVCRSPMVEKWNAGKLREGCDAIYTEDERGRPTGWYIRSGGEVRRGLINRRKDEKAKCIAGIKGTRPATVEIPYTPAPPSPRPAPAPIPLTVEQWLADPYACFGAARYDVMRDGKACPVEPAPRKSAWSWIFK